MSYTFTWGSLLQNQWIDSTALNSALQSFVFYSITGSNQPTSSPNFVTTSNHFLTKVDINNYIYSPEFTSTGISKLDNQYIAVRDLIPQPITFSIYYGFAGPSDMMYNPNDELIYVADIQAGSWKRDSNNYNLTYSNIYCFNPLSLGTSSESIGNAGVTTSIPITYLGTISAPNYPYWSYITDFSYTAKCDTSNNKIYLTGHSTISGEPGGLRIFDINSHQLITITYSQNGNTTQYYRIGVNILENILVLPSKSGTFQIDRPTSSSELSSIRNALQSTLKLITFETSSGAIADSSFTMIQVGNYLCVMGEVSTSSTRMGIYNITPTGNHYSLYTTYPGYNTTTSLANQKKYATYGWSGNNNNYSKGFYYDSDNKRLYIADLGTSCITVINVSNSDPNNWITIFTCFFNYSNPTNHSTFVDTSHHAQFAIFKAPNGNLYCSVTYLYNLTTTQFKLITHIINPIATNENNFISTTYNDIGIDILISAGGLNLYGSHTFTQSQPYYSAGYQNSGIITKYGLNITGAK